MITAYVDESGTHQGSKVLIVAAYVGSSEEWDSAEIRFKRADHYAGRTFHAVDCAQGGKKYRGMDNSKRYRITKKIVKIVNDHALFGIISGAYLDDYEAVVPRDGKHWEKWLAPTFTLVFQILIVEIADYVRRTYPKQRFSVAMEESEHWYIPAAKKFLRMKHDTTSAPLGNCWRLGQTEG